jgi:hypothetical protein
MLIVRLASYFEPLRFFLPISAVVFVLGTLRAIRDVIVVNQFGAMSVILLLTAFQIFAFGVIADVIVRHFQIVPTSPKKPAAEETARQAASDPSDDYHSGFSAEPAVPAPRRQRRSRH